MVLHATTLGRSTAIVRDGGDILNERDVEPGGLKGAQSSLSARSGAFHIDLNVLHAMFHGLLAGDLSSDLSGKRGALARALEPLAAGAGPGYGVAAGIRNGDDSIVECRTDMSYPVQNVLALFFLPCGGLVPCHGSSDLCLLALAHNRPARAFACASIRVSALPANRQSPTMPKAPVAAKIHKALDVHGDFSSQITFNLVMSIYNLPDGIDLSISKVIALGIPIDAGFGKDLLRRGPTDTVDVCQSDLHPLIFG